MKPWLALSRCPPCQQLKPLIHRLAQLLSAEPQIAIAVIDTDENDALAAVDGGGGLGKIHPFFIGKASISMGHRTTMASG